jgi:rhodanese-related sulfurtransferase
MDISPEEFAPFQEREGILILDVRTPAEYAECRVLYAVNLPLDQLSSEEVMRLSEGKSDIFAICRSGARSAAACSKLAEWGFRSRNVAGGTVACVKAGLPLEALKNKG